MRLIDHAGGKAGHFSPIPRRNDPLCAAKSAKPAPTFPLGSQRSLRSDRRLANRLAMASRPSRIDHATGARRYRTPIIRVPVQTVETDRPDRKPSRS